MYVKTGLFRVTCDYVIKAKNFKQAENYAKEEAGLIFFEKHLIVKPIEIPVDIDLTSK